MTNDFDLKGKASDEDAVWSQGVVDNLLYTNELLRRQVSIYEKALKELKESIHNTNCLFYNNALNGKDVHCAGCSRITVALEEGRMSSLSQQKLDNTCDHEWLTPHKNRTTCKLCGYDGWVKT